VANGSALGLNGDTLLLKGMNPGRKINKVMRFALC